MEILILLVVSMLLISVSVVVAYVMLSDSEEATTVAPTVISKNKKATSTKTPINANSVIVATKTPFKEYATAADERGIVEGGPVKLEKHKVQCPRGEVLNDIKLEFVDDAFIGQNGKQVGRMQYKYKCATEFPTDKQTAISSFVTDRSMLCNNWCGEDYTGYSPYLASHNISCPADHVLSNFKMKNTGNKPHHGHHTWYDVEYDYGCQKAASPLQCEIKQTPVAAGEHHSLKHLKDLHVKCPDNQAIGRVQMRITNDKKPFYEYTCCKPVAE